MNEETIGSRLCTAIREDLNSGYGLYAAFILDPLRKLVGLAGFPFELVIMGLNALSARFDEKSVLRTLVTFLKLPFEAVMWFVHFIRRIIAKAIPEFWRKELRIRVP